MNRRAATALAALGFVFTAGAARADPVFPPPEAGARAVLARRAGGAPSAMLLLDVGAIAALGAERDTELADLGALSVGELALVRLRLGLWWRSGRWPAALTLRADFAELARVDADPAGAAIGRVVDDAYLRADAGRALALRLGRGPVPLSRYRELEDHDLSGVSVPFAVARIAPRRRWGAVALGDLGALAYAVGAFADGDRLEPRFALAGAPAQDADPSTGGDRGAYALHVEWTPRAPIGRGVLATSARDPWFDWVRVSTGMGALVRLREQGARADLAAHVMAKRRRLSAMAELVAGIDADAFELAATGELAAMLGERGAVFARGELERCAERGAGACRAVAHTSGGALDQLWTAGAGAAWFVTADRRSRVALHGWLRRGDRGAFAADGAIVELATAL